MTGSNSNSPIPSITEWNSDWALVTRGSSQSLYPFPSCYCSSLGGGQGLHYIVETPRNCACFFWAKDVKFISVSRARAWLLVRVHSWRRQNCDSEFEEEVSQVLSLGSASEEMMGTRKSATIAGSRVSPFSCFRPLGKMPAQKPPRQPGNGSP